MERAGGQEDLPLCPANVSNGPSRTLVRAGRREFRVLSNKSARVATVLSREPGPDAQRITPRAPRVMPPIEGEASAQTGWLR